MAGEFDLHLLLAGPVIAMNDAQADAAASFYELFEQFAFEPAEAASRGAEPAARRLRMISFLAERATPSGIERRQISMPLLQMIPIGGVAIDSAKIQFSLAVNAEPAASAKRTAAAPVHRAVALKARIAPAAASETAAGNLQVEIMLKQVDLPAGYLDMIAETQGGMSRVVPEAPAAGEEEEAALFSASVRDVSAPQITPGKDYELVLQIVPNPRLIGPDGLQVAFASVPKRAFEIVAPQGVVRSGREPRRELVRILPGDMTRFGAREVALLLEGASTGPDGIRRQHAVSIALPRQRG